jgi:hypothetical protein
VAEAAWLQSLDDFQGIYAILKQKSKHNFSWELAERARFFKKVTLPLVGIGVLSAQNRVEFGPF